MSLKNTSSLVLFRCVCAYPKKCPILNFQPRIVKPGHHVKKKSLMFAHAALRCAANFFCACSATAQNAGDINHRRTTSRVSAFNYAARRDAITQPMYAPETLIAEMSARTRHFAVILAKIQQHLKRVTLSAHVYLTLTSI